MNLTHPPHPSSGGLLPATAQLISQVKQLSDLTGSLQVVRNPYFEANLLDELTLGHLAFLREHFGLGGNDRYLYWRNVLSAISDRFARDHSCRRAGSGENWKYVKAAETTGEWDRAVELAGTLDPDYARLIERKLYVAETKRALPCQVPFEPVFLLLARARITELDKPDDLRQRTREREQRAKLRSDGAELEDSFGTYLNCFSEDEAISIAWSASKPGSPQLPSETAGSLFGASLRHISLPDLKSVFSDNSDFLEFVQAQDPALFSEVSTKVNLTGADFIRVARYLAPFEADKHADVLSQIGELFLPDLPSIRAPGQKKIGYLEAPTDASHMTFEGIVQLSKESGVSRGASVLAERLCEVWEIPVTQSKHRNWKRSSRGRRKSANKMRV